MAPLQSMGMRGRPREMHARVGLHVGPERKVDGWRQVVPLQPLHGNEGQATEDACGSRFARRL